MIEPDTIEVRNPVTLSAGSIPCERIPLGEPGDYKPCVAQLPNGELLLTMFRQIPQTGGRLLEQSLLFRSQDGGRTWLGPELLDLLGREPYLTVLSDGTLFLTGHLLSQDVRNEYGYIHGYLHRSTDSGRTWESLRIGSEQIRPGAITHTTRNVLELADGTLLVGVDYKDFSSRGGPYFMWRSTDRGATWDQTRTCEPAGFESIYGFFGGETWLWQHQSGKVVALVRVDSEEFPIEGLGEISSEGDQDDRFMVWESEDEGRTFRRVGDIGDYGEMYLSILRLGGERLLLTYTVRSRKPPLGVRAVPGVETDELFEFDFDRDLIMLDTKTGDRYQGGGFGPTVQLADGTMVTSYSYRAAPTADQPEAWGAAGPTLAEVVRWRLPELRGDQ